MYRITQVSFRGMFGVLAVCSSLAACAAEMGDEAMTEDDVDVASEALTLSGFMLRNTNTGKCISAASTSGADVSLVTCNTSSVNQRWGFDGGFLKHSPSGLCLDLEGASLNNGAAVQVFNCTGGTNQDFRFYPILGAPAPTLTSVTNWYMVVKHSGKCIEQGGSTGPAVLQSSGCQGAWNLVY